MMKPHYSTLRMVRTYSTTRLEYLGATLEEMEEAKSTSGKQKLSLSLKIRFKKTFKEELREMTLPQVPNNTSANTRWAIKNFTDWLAAHNSDATDDDLVSSIGASNFSLLRSIATSQGIKEKPYADLVRILREHFGPKPSEVGQRFKFNSYIRKPGESVATFVAKLRALSEDCDFGDSLEVMIRDRLVFGINDKAIQKRLLAEPKLTYKRAVELAQELESADRDMKLFHGKKEAVYVEPSTSAGQIQAVQKVTHRALKCFRCGATGHIQCSY